MPKRKYAAKVEYMSCLNAFHSLIIHFDNTLTSIFTQKNTFSFVGYIVLPIKTIHTLAQCRKPVTIEEIRVNF